MKTLTVLIIALASLSTVYAAESETSDPVAVPLPGIEEITIAMADAATAPAGECKAVCALPPSFFE